jgi:ABC-type dipeptide/oligopeptide/nickel transport system ATPase component
MVFQEPKGSLSPYFTVGEQARETVRVHFGAEAASKYKERAYPLLDAITEHQVLELLASLLREREFALLLITHDLGIMTRLVDEVAVMKEGGSLSREPCPRSWKAPLRTATRTRES